jgi:PIN domain nuclease of toxin-antitoxin system
MGVSDALSFGHSHPALGIDCVKLPQHACTTPHRRWHNEILVSAVSAWEIGAKVRLGKLPTGEELISDFSFYLKQLGVEALPISIEHALRAERLPGEHRDPFDRMLIAQAQAEDIPILSNDRIFDEYHVQRIW